MPKNSTAEDRTQFILTAYSGGFAHVIETRFIPPLTDDMVVHYYDVPKLIEADSVMVSGLNISEQSFSFIPDKQSFLNRIVGREILVGFPEAEREFILLNAAGGLIGVDQNGHIVTNLKGEVRLSDPEGFHFSPTLIWQVEEQTASTLTLSYLTGGVSWEADYNLMLKGSTFSLQSWATVRNDSGMDAVNMELRLLAGTVNRAFSLRPMEFSMAAKMPEQQAFSDYHLYTYPEIVTIPDQSQKQLQLISAQHAAYDTIYEVREGKRHPSVVIEFMNSEGNALGIPLPGGQVKVFKEEKGKFAFIGEASIGHTAVGEKVKLAIGEAFDITIFSGDINRYVKDGFEYEVMLYEIRNQKDEAANMLIRHIPDGVIWTVEESSHPWERKNNEILIRLTVPPKTNQDVKFTIKYDRSLEKRH